MRIRFVTMKFIFSKHKDNLILPKSKIIMIKLLAKNSKYFIGSDQSIRSNDCTKQLKLYFNKTYSYPISELNTNILA